jgi:hypothetical protein
MSSAAAAGAAAAFGTCVLFVLLNFVRVNVMLDQIADRPDWQNMTMRFRASGAESFRVFVNLEYLKGTPLKIAAATAIGTVMGILGGVCAGLTRGESR